jgi:hypothetical protein
MHDRVLEIFNGSWLFNRRSAQPHKVKRDAEAWRQECVDLLDEANLSQ